jgi:hypothetical protein
VVIFPGDDSPKLRNYTLGDLWPALEGTGAIVVPHHPNATSEGGPQAWSAQAWQQHNPAYQAVAEIAQNRGAFETDTPGGATVIGGHGASLQDALAQGCRLGFAGGSDSHYGRPGSASCPMGGVDHHDHVTGGLTAVFAPALTREAIHAALQARRCYATTGARMLVEFLVDGHPMGTEFTRGPGAVAVAARVTGTAPLARLEVVSGVETANVSGGRPFVAGQPGATGHGQPGRRNQEPGTAYAQPATGRSARLTCELPVRDGETRYFYLRATQTDGHTAWSSPVWVTARVTA